MVDEGGVAVGDDVDDKEVGDASSLSLSFGCPEGDVGECAIQLGEVPGVGPFPQLGYKAT